jgi:hypothetical protein
MMKALLIPLVVGLFFKFYLIHGRIFTTQKERLHFLCGCTSKHSHQKADRRV